MIKLLFTVHAFDYVKLIMIDDKIALEGAVGTEI
jgi:hypothetical protein